MNIIGIGTPGCGVASEFEAYEQYKVCYIDHENKHGYKNFHKVTRRDSHEEYESKYRKIKLNIESKEQTVLVLSGAGKISGLVLRLLEQIKVPSVEVLYIKPDFSLLSAAEKTRHKIVLGILQQYARSRLINKIHVVDNSLVEKVVGDISIQSYWSDINKAISSTFHMLQVFENTEPLLSNFNSPGQTSNIGTFGVLSFNNFDEKAFYDLNKPRCKKYFFGVTEKTLNNEKDLLQRIRKFLSSQQDEKCDYGFAIYSTQYEHDYVYTTHHASLVQEEDIALQK